MTHEDFEKAVNDFAERLGGVRTSEPVQQGAGGALMLSMQFEPDFQFLVTFDTDMSSPWSVEAAYPLAFRRCLPGYGASLKGAMKHFCQRAVDSAESHLKKARSLKQRLQ